MNINYLVGLLLAVASASAMAQQKSCDELKGEIDAKIQAKHVSGYVLEVVESKDVGDKTVVGSCDAGARKVVYRRSQKGA